MIAAVKSFFSKFDNDWKIRFCIILPVLLIWLSVLFSTDSLFSPYILYALVCMVSCTKNTKQNNNDSKGTRIIHILFSLFFSGAITLANYKMFVPAKEHIIKIAVLFIGGFLVGWYIIKLLLNIDFSTRMTVRIRKHKLLWFLLPFIFFTLEYLAVLFFCYKPGFLTPDSISQIGQILSNNYSNHHPYWHTMIIKIFFDLGMAVFNDINMAVVLYHIFQIICMAAIFSFISMTIYEMGVPVTWIVITVISYAVLPYHILYSMTMWKDILFGGVVALFICTFYRLMIKIGISIINYLILVLSAFGCCLLRSNGLPAFIFTFIVMAVILRKKEARMLIVLLAVIVASFILKHPVLKALDVSQPDTAEYLSIPLQQVARLIVDEKKLEDEDLKQIEQIMDVKAIKNEYKSYNSDPVKNNVRNNNASYLDEHKSDYLLLWLRLGKKYPVTYIKAWVDQTKGYWNGGYDYWIVANGVMENDFGITKAVLDNGVSGVVEKWVQQFMHIPAFEVFRSIGLHVWTLTACFAVLVMKKRREWLLFVMPLALILTLLITTPLFSEFRYAYSIFTAFPLLLAVCFFSQNDLKV